MGRDHSDVRGRVSCQCGRKAVCWKGGISRHKSPVCPRDSEGSAVGRGHVPGYLAGHLRMNILSSIMLSLGGFLDREMTQFFCGSFFTVKCSRCENYYVLKSRALTFRDAH